MVRALRPLVVAHRIRRCRVIHSIAVREFAAHRSARPKADRAKRMPPIEKAVAGQRIRAVERRGKYVLMALEHGWLVMHFKFDGQLRWFDSGKLTGHVDVAFDLQPRGTLGFVDPRHLGKVRFVDSPDDLAGVRAMGVDPLSKEFTREALAKLVEGYRRPLKLFLLDQGKVAGIGNIYSNEMMWHARFNPQRAANSLTNGEVRRLHKAIGDVLNRALECCLHPAPDFRDASWWFQGLERILRVYGREGEKCRRCGHTIERIEQGGRGTYWCPHCQR